MREGRRPVCVRLDEAGRPLVEGEDRLVPYWSFSKTLIAATALHLAERGTLDRRAPPNGEAPSLDALLSHRAGLKDYGANPDYQALVASRGPPWSMERYFAEADASWEPRPPVGTFRYSNIGYLEVRRRIQMASGCDLGETVRDVVTGPLGLSGIRLAKTPHDVSKVDMGRAAPGYHPRYVAHGLFVGTVSDAARALHSITMTDAVLTRDTRRKMTTLHRIGGAIAGRPWLVPSYGLGLMGGRVTGGLEIFGHTGGGPGSRFAAYCCCNTGAIAAAFVPDDRDGDGPVEQLCMERLASSSDQPSSSGPLGEMGQFPV